ncbi:hypothetical protein ACJJIF_08945 [Microbulbifer sp. SSSA002]|uniref:hypothetical protein n=1 Tax=Microbulbifer sp. SSSA002 TaxID=3243376 RepID=UPI00403934C9
MRCLSESIARQANAEDNCTGRFWEGRFKSQALLDERALAACLAYVDLNPIRAGIAKTPEESDYTSIQQRIHTAISGQQPKSLLPLVGGERQDMPKGLPFQLDHYLELVDWSGRQLHPKKRGVISENIPPILNRLGISPKHWLYLNSNFESRFKRLVARRKRYARSVRSKINAGYTGCAIANAFLVPPPAKLQKSAYQLLLDSIAPDSTLP